MTTITYRNGVVAADTRAWSGDPTPIGHKAKIFRRESDGAIVGASSADVGVTGLFVAWALAGEDPDDTPHIDEKEGFEGIVFLPDGTFNLYVGTFRKSGPLHAEYTAIGSGSRYALGAFAGSAAVDAVKAAQVACELDTYSALPVQALHLSLNS